MSLAQRSVRSSTYNIAASAIQTIVQFGRSIVLARLLAPDDFGIYSYVMSFVVLTRDLPSFGMISALLHRACESEGEQALRVHFTLSLIFNLIWASGLAGIGYFVIVPKNHWVLLVILATQVVDNLSLTGKMALARKVLFARIAVINTIITVLGTATALLLAWRGAGLLSLVSTDIIAALVPIIGYYIYQPTWKPRLGWSRDVVHYFISFGKRSLVASLLQEAMDNVDDLWTGRLLGDAALGYYSRAYTFATYPRRVLAMPLNNVAASTYASLKENRKRLSQAFFRVNAFLVRSGFFFAGLMALVAPEFIHLAIGIKWLPMLDAFRLMLIYTMLDPIKATISNVFTAVGKPEKTVLARLIGLCIMLIGLVILGPRWGIAGVALAVDIMIVVTITILLCQARAHVDFSLRRMSAIPALALGLGMLAARAAIALPGIVGSPWRTGGLKIVVFSLIYGATLLLLERELIPMLFKIYRQLRPEHIQETDAKPTDVEQT
ncbi:MAG: oligosaccharide flippase family protein [Anaerolineales bacterium]|nr:oligosaccharide flippase family protein [Anaerolineales bacterium]